MPGSFGLFSSLAMESGGFQKWVSTSLENATATFESLAWRVGCGGGGRGSPATRRCLEAADARALVWASQGSPQWPMPVQDSLDACIWAPVVDGVELVAPPLDLARRDALAPNVSLLLGTNRDEGMSFVGYARTGAAAKIPEDLDEEGWLAWLRANFGDAAAELLNDLYHAPRRRGDDVASARGTPPPRPPAQVPVNATDHDPDDGTYASYNVALEYVVGDYMMNCPNRRVLFRRPT